MRVYSLTRGLTRALTSSVGASGGTYLVHGTTLNANFTVTRSGTATRRDSSGLIETVAANEPRFDYDANGTLLGLLVEESRTNLLTHSEQFDNAAWARQNGATVVSDQATSPDGKATMDSVQAGDSAPQSGIHQTVSLTANTVYAPSIFLKAGTSSLTRYGVWDPTGLDWQAFVDIAWTAGVPSTSASSGASDIKYEETGEAGVYRVSFAATSDTLNTTHSVQLHPDRNGTNGNVYAWGAQLEEGAFATSYIPTTTASVTRSADDIVCTDLSAIEVDAAVSSILARYQTAAGVGAVQNVFSLSDNTANERVELRSNGTKNNVIIVDGGVTQANIQQAGSIVALTDYDAGIAVAANDVAFYLDGASEGSDASVTVPAYSRMYLGADYNGGMKLNGHIKTLRYYPQRLSNAQLQSLTA